MPDIRIAAGATVSAEVQEGVALWRIAVKFAGLRSTDTGMQRAPPQTGTLRRMEGRTAPVRDTSSISETAVKSRLFQRSAAFDRIQAQSGKDLGL